jgi:hypothetical protein
VSGASSRLLIVDDETPAGVGQARAALTGLV